MCTEDGRGGKLFGPADAVFFQTMPNGGNGPTGHPRVRSRAVPGLLREPARAARRSMIHDHAPLAVIGHERGPMILDLRWRAVAVGRWLASCAWSATRWAIGMLRPMRPENPDPGNRRLRALAADQIFASLPPGAVRTRWRKYPAKFPIIFFAGGDVWSEPCVILRFTSAQSVLDVLHFYAERALETGWQEQPRDLPRTWSKHIAGRQASTTLFNDFDRSVNITESRTPRSYLLRASFSGPQLWSSFFVPAALRHRIRHPQCPARRHNPSPRPRQ
jgi:hypothetical protein